MPNTPVTTFTVLKNLGYIPAILLGLSMEGYTILGTLMVIDTLFGVIRVYVVQGGRHIKSYKLIAGVLSKITVISIPVLLVWTGRGAGLDFLPIAKASLGILVLAESYSILGSIYSIRTKKETEEWDAVTWVIRSLQKILERIIKSK